VVPCVCAYCFWRRIKSRKLLVGNICNLVGICPMGNARSGYKLVTFDFESYFRTLSFAMHMSSVISNFECLGNFVFSVMVHF